MPRKNPMTKFAAFAYADQDALYLREMKKADKKYGFEEAATALSEWEGKSLEETRAHGLRRIAEYVRTLVSADSALLWITANNRRLGVWCCCACARQTFPRLRRNKEVAYKAVKVTEDWVRGKASGLEVSKAARAVIQKTKSEGYSWSHHAAHTAASSVYIDRSYVGGLAYTVSQVIPKDVNLLDVIADAIMTFPKKS